MISRSIMRRSRRLNLQRPSLRQILLLLRILLLVLALLHLLKRLLRS
jgi:flagellar biogenesis protein FliO